MNIDFTNEDIKKIIAEKYGCTSFRIFYFETDAMWENRTNKKIIDCESEPEKINIVLNF